MISVLIPTLNEEASLPDCLDSVKRADDIVVVNSGTGDCTCEIARAAAARAVGTKNVESRTVVAGNPARLIRKREMKPVTPGQT